MGFEPGKDNDYDNPAKIFTLYSPYKDKDETHNPLPNSPYVMVEWLRSDHDQHSAYIDTLFKPDQDTSVEIKYQYFEPSTVGSGVLVQEQPHLPGHTHLL